MLPNRMRLFAPLAPALLAALTALMAAPQATLSAQEATTPAEQKPAKPMAPVISMSFPGGTMASFVASLRAAEPKSNILVALHASDARLPAMVLSAAGLDQVLDSACAIAESDYNVRCVESRGNGEPVFAIVAMVKGPGAHVGTNREDEPTTIVLSLNPLTEGDERLGLTGIRVTTILSAVEAGGAFDKMAPQMRYHQDSGLLFLRGTREQLQLASEVLKSLGRDQDDRRRRGPKAGNQPTDGGQAGDKKDR